MDSTVIDVGPVLFLVLAALTLFAATVFGLTRLGSGPAVARAAVRAVLQLGVVSLIIVAVLASWWSTGAFIAVMYVVASVTSARRINSRRARWAAAVPIGFGVFPALGLLVASHALPATPLAVLPTAGILTGGAMTATTLAGRRALDELHARHGEYEAGLALGFGERDAVLEVCRTSAGQALVPALDQTGQSGLSRFRCVRRGAARRREPDPGRGNAAADPHRLAGGGDRRHRGHGRADRPRCAPPLGRAVRRRYRDPAGAEARDPARAT